MVTPDAEYAGLGSVTVEPGTLTADATAKADDIRLGKTAYGADGKMTGTIADYDGSSEPASGKSLFARLVDRSITEVTAADLAGITEISNYAFAGAPNLKSIIIPDIVTNFGNFAFYNCRSLTNITIPNSVVSIGEETFRNCSSLISIMIPDGVTVIPWHAFDGCISLTSVTIPDSVTAINVAVFRNCTGLISIMIPDSVTTTGYDVFRYCSKLTSITIGSGMRSIGSSTFDSCSVNTELGGTYTILATTPPIIQSNTFDNAKINKIIVPVGTGAAYKAATNWSALADKMVEADE